jgi:chromosome segregation ATPase
MQPSPLPAGEEAEERTRGNPAKNKKGAYTVNERLKELVSTWRAAEQAVTDCQARIDTLTAKADSLQQEIPVKSRQLDDARTLKEKAFDAFIEEQITQADLDGARGAYEQAQKEFTGSQEMVDATYRAAKRAEGELPKLHQTREAARVKVWQAIASDLKEKARAALGDTLVRAYVAAAQCGGGNLQAFLVDAVGMPPTGEFNQIRDDIEREYLEGGRNVKERKRG